MIRESFIAINHALNTEARKRLAQDILVSLNPQQPDALHVMFRGKDQVVRSGMRIRAHRGELKSEAYNLTDPIRATPVATPLLGNPASVAQALADLYDLVTDWLGPEGIFRRLGVSWADESSWPPAVRRAGKIIGEDRT